MMKLLLYEDLVKIAQFLKENNYDSENLLYVIEVADKKTLDKVNEEFYYKYSGHKDGKPSYTDMVNISINGVNFRYLTKPDDNED